MDGVDHTYVCHNNNNIECRSVMYKVKLYVSQNPPAPLKLSIYSQWNEAKHSEGPDLEIAS